MYPIVRAHCNPQNYEIFLINAKSQLQEGLTQTSQTTQTSSQIKFFSSRGVFCTQTSADQRRLYI